MDLRADTIVLYISDMTPTQPQLFRISANAMEKFDSNLEMLFHSEKYRDYAEEITQSSFVGIKEYESSYSMTPTVTIDRIFFS